MSNLRRVLEMQEREEEEIQRRRAEEDREANEEEEEMLVGFAMLNESRQHHRRRAQNVDRRRQSRGKNLMENYFIPNSLYPVSKFRERYRMQPHLFQKIMHDICNYDTYFIQKYDACGVLGLLPEQKLTAALRMLAYGASAEQVDEIARMGKSTILECLMRFCDAVENLYTREYLRRPSPADLQRLLKKADTRGDYGNRKGQKSIILEAVASFDTWVWHAFFGVAGSQNDLNVLGQSPVFNDVLRGHSPQITYQINNTVYSEGYRKDVERCFGILQARWAIIRGAARMLDEEVLRSIMMTCIILHNMIVEDEYDYEATEEFEPDPMNTSLTRIYERPLGPNGHSLEHEPLVRDGRFNNPMIDRYQEMQSSYVHERCQIDLIEHLWEMKGNHNE
ncbi:hypothetical protein ACE6H2_016077 [Prunus campanulata]